MDWAIIWSIIVGLGLFVLGIMTLGLLTCGIVVLTMRKRIQTGGISGCPVANFLFHNKTETAMKQHTVQA